MAQVPRARVDALTRALGTLSADMRARLAAALAMVDFSAPVAEVREACVAAMELYCGPYSDMAAELAAGFYDDVRELAAGERLGALAESGREPAATDGAVRAVMRDAVEGMTAEGVARKLLDRADYELRRAAGECVYRNGARDPLDVRYARVPSGGKTCAFCIMLASRGFAYRSGATAGGHYHANCDCRVVPGFEGAESGVEGYDPDLYYDMWKHPEKHTPNRDFSSVEYGEYRGLSYIDDGLKSHHGDGSDLDPVKMVSDDTGFSKKRAEQVIDDMFQWTGEGYSSIRRREGRYSEIADRIEELIASSSKYKGEVYRGIGVERDVADGIVSSLLEGMEVDQLGISSWATEIDWAQEFGDMNLDRCSDGVKIIFHLKENRTGVSIKHIAAAVDNDEVIASENMRYILDGNIEMKNDPYDGEYLLIPVKEV